jgi:hypothetical protein
VMFRTPLSRDSTGFANLLRDLDRCVAAADRPFGRHYRTGGQSEKQSILLPVEVKDYLIRCHVRSSY